MRTLSKKISLIAALLLGVQSSITADTLPLSTGWNLVGANSNMSLETLQEKVGVDNLLVVQGASKGYKKSYVDNGESFLNDFIAFEEGKGYWINVGVDKTVDFTAENKSITIELAKGWNLINPTTEMSLEMILLQVGKENLLTIQGESKSYKKAYVDADQAFLNDFTQFEEPKGYWVKVDEAATLRFIAPMFTIGQALLGPLSDADFSISRIDDGTVIAEGKTTTGDGVDVSTAGLIQVSEDIKDTLSTGLYMVSVSGGTDIDKDDNNVWDEVPTANEGTLHAIVNDSTLKKGDFKVNILTEVVYQAIKETLETDSQAEIEEAIAQKAEVLLKEADGGGDVDSDGDIDSDDLIAWNPAEDKEKLAVDYEEEIEPIAEKILAGEDNGQDVSVIFNVPPIVDAGEDINATVGSNVHLQALANDRDGSIVSYEWSEGDTILSRAESFTKSDFSYGEHNITLTVTDNMGAFTRDEVTVIIGRYVLASKYVKDLLPNNWQRKVPGTITYTYDMHGFLASEVEVSQDSTRNYVRLYENDADGNILRQSFDYTNDGVVDFSNVYTYDDMGNLLSDGFERDGNFTVREFHSYVYDERGNVLNYKLDENGNGVVDSEIIKTYDLTNNVLTIMSYDNGVLSSSQENVYDEQGNLLEYTQFDENGVAEFVGTSTYDEDGNELSFHHNHIRIKNQWKQYYTYDEKGNLLTSVYDQDADGTIDRINGEYIYDDDGNLIKNVTPYDTITYTYDDLHNRLSATDEYGNIRTWRYDENNNLIEEKFNDLVEFSQTWLFVQ